MGEDNAIPTRWKIWATVIGFGLFVYATRGVLLPFIVGFAVAYLLDPVADRLEEWKFPRWLAAASIIVVFFLAATGLILAMAPLVQSQLADIAQNLPGYVSKVRELAESSLSSIVDNLDLGTRQDTDSLIAAATEKGVAKLGGMFEGLISGGLAIFNLLSLLVISPVIAFFLLRDWDLIVERVDGWLPRRQEPVIKEQLTKIDMALAGFVRGQTMVCLIMGTLYAIGWTVVGLDYGLILGIIAGILGFIPFAGTFFALIIALLVGLGQWGPDLVNLGFVAGVFVLVQALEGAVLTPRLIGSRVGLHPAWVMFAIFAGGELMGFVGILIAVPAAAVIAVMVRFGLDQYLASSAYGAEVEPAQAPPVVVESSESETEREDPAS